MGKILVAGSINMDVVVRTKQYPQAGETVFGHDLHYIPGGKGSNQAVAASRAGDNVYLLAKLGKDAFGQSLTQFLQEESLHLDYLCYSDTHPSGVALITINESSENMIVVASGSNFELNEEEATQIPLEADDIVASVFEIPQTIIKHLFSRAKQIGATTILNPAPATTFIDALLPLVDFLIINETELA
ncbi:MAG: PfkB family carbohydrate kinase, partial [Phototrophicaceae bacterium]